MVNKNGLDGPSAPNKNALDGPSVADKFEVDGPSAFNKFASDEKEKEKKEVIVERTKDKTSSPLKPFSLDLEKLPVATISDYTNKDMDSLIKRVQPSQFIHPTPMLSQNTFAQRIGVIRSGDRLAAIDALKLTASQVMAATPMEHVNDLLEAIFAQMHTQFVTLNVTDEEPVRLTKHLVNGLVQVFSNKPLAITPAKETLEFVFYELVERLLDDELSKQEPGNHLSRALNGNALEWKRRTQINASLSDMPLRTVKTLLHELASVYQDSVTSFLIKIDQPDKSFCLFVSAVYAGEATEPETASSSTSAPPAASSRATSDAVWPTLPSSANPAVETELLYANPEQYKEKLHKLKEMFGIQAKTQEVVATGSSASQESIEEQSVREKEWVRI
ncbi:hypothetical protein BJ742DRAFT_903250 [Cladochytrium replicatum]|nr:hypothetical protein BJ742DRAFT_903250 [Cladochytrium replicatum]